jgi:hypothetical protein
MTVQSWVKTRNIIAFPVGWQRLANTEEWIYNKCIDQLPYNHYLQVICFPWATIIDLQRRGKRDAAALFLSALRWVPPKTTLTRATVCQHINALDLWADFKRLKITDVSWCHARSSLKELDGIKIHPHPLYPAQCFDEARDEVLLLPERLNKILSDQNELPHFMQA